MDASSFPLESLPEDLVAFVCTKVAADSVKEIHNLRRVSKRFNRLCQEQLVLQHVSFRDIPLHPWFTSDHYYREFSTFVGICADAKNPDAELRVGLDEYFKQGSDDQLQEKGLKRISSAADKGNKEAQFFLGTIFLCIGGENKEKGFQFLTSFRVPFGPSGPSEWFEHCQVRLINDLKWGAQPMLNRMKSTYVRDKCSCQGIEEMQLLAPEETFWERLHRLELLIYQTSIKPCVICYCHFLIQMFFLLMEV